METFDTSAQAIEDSVKTLLQSLGEDPNREGLKDTPSRVAKSWRVLFGGYAQRAEDILSATFHETSKYDEVVLLRDIAFYSTCEHHMLPFYGRAHVAYIPDASVVGVSKLARLVDMHSRRLQIQERMTSDIASDLETVLRPRGVAVLVEAQHFCIQSRGVQKQDAVMVTSKMSGAFRSNAAARKEFFDMVRGGK